MNRMLPIAMALLLGTAACGGGSGDDADDGGAAQPTAAPATVAPAEAASATTVGGESSDVTPPPADADADAGNGGAEGSGPSTATVTLGDQTYNFSTEGALVAQCQINMFGVFLVQLPMVDGDGDIQILILHDDTDPSVVEEVNAVQIGVGDEDWTADEASELFDMSDQLEPGMSQVDSAVIDGSTVRGTATFVRDFSVFGGEVETVTGTFEATCGEERLT